VREQDLEWEAFGLEFPLRLMDTSTASVKLVILDACRDNPLVRRLARSIREVGRSTMVGNGLARIDGAAGTLIAYATAPGDIAVDGQGRNSPFTAAMLSWIDEPGLEVRAMFGRVREAVYTATNRRQVPWVNESLIGEFHFRRSPAASREPQRPETGAGMASPTTSSPATAIALAAPPSLAARSDTAAFELTFWNSVKDSGDPAMFEAYMNRYPQGAFVELARLKIGASTETDVGRKSEPVSAIPRAELDDPERLAQVVTSAAAPELLRPASEERLTAAEPAAMPSAQIAALPPLSAPPEPLAVEPALRRGEPRPNPYDGRWQGKFDFRSTAFRSPARDREVLAEVVAGELRSDSRLASVSAIVGYDGNILKGYYVHNNSRFWELRGSLESGALYSRGHSVGNYRFERTDAGSQVARRESDPAKIGSLPDLRFATVRSVSVHAEPSTNTQVISVLSPGAFVKVNGKPTGLNWYRVWMPNQQAGYLPADTVTLKKRTAFAGSAERGGRGGARGDPGGSSAGGPSGGRGGGSSASGGGSSAGGGGSSAGGGGGSSTGGGNDRSPGGNPGGSGGNDRSPGG
jgi:hypothetical protein